VSCGEGPNGQFAHTAGRAEPCELQTGYLVVGNGTLDQGGNEREVTLMKAHDVLIAVVAIAIVGIAILQVPNA
jgi:hypothetical protein